MTIDKMIERLRRDDTELSVAAADELTRLRAENAELRGELVEKWKTLLEKSSWRFAIGPDAWLRPTETSRHAAAQLHKLGLVEKHPDREAYRFVKGGE